MLIFEYGYEGGFVLALYDALPVDAFEPGMHQNFMHTLSGIISTRIPKRMRGSFRKRPSSRLTHFRESLNYSSMTKSWNLMDS